MTTSTDSVLGIVNKGFEIGKAGLGLVTAIGAPILGIAIASTAIHFVAPAVPALIDGQGVFTWGIGLAGAAYLAKA